MIRRGGRVPGLFAKSLRRPLVDCRVAGSPSRSLYCQTTLLRHQVFKDLSARSRLKGGLGPCCCENLRALGSFARPKVQDRVPPRWTGYWLIGSAGLVFGIVVIGGLTRLTESGLSITEWKPITGTLPPFSAGQWEAEFDKYKASPEFKVLNSDMTMSEFKFIYYMEWAHRVWGRAIGVSFVLPTLYLLARKQVPPSLRNRLLGISGLIGFQGFIGWWMVKSGLSDQDRDRQGVPRVSQYRLAAHLGAAFSVYLAMLSSGLDVLHAPRSAAATREQNQAAALLRDPRLNVLRKSVVGLGGLIFLTAISGAFVAGLDAGLVYNEWPYMGHNRFVPPKQELFAPEYSRKEDKSDIYWRNPLENPVTAQFDHRVLATTSFFATLGLSTLALTRYKNLLPGPVKRAFWGVSGLVSLQASLGITTLLYLVPVPLAAAHQAGSLALLTGITVLMKRMRVPKSIKLDSFAQNIRTQSNPSRVILNRAHPASGLHTLTARSGMSSRGRSTSSSVSRRCFHSSAPSYHGDYPELKPGEGYEVTFIMPDSETKKLKVPEGVSLLDIAHEHDIDIEGACEGSCACSTCHVIVDPEHYDRLPEPSDEENDMLDLAFGLEETSRLGCQVIMNQDTDGIVVRVPPVTRNMRVDGSKPIHH